MYVYLKPGNSFNNYYKLGCKLQQCTIASFRSYGGLLSYHPKDRKIPTPLIPASLTTHPTRLPSSPWSQASQLPLVPSFPHPQYMASFTPWSLASKSTHRFQSLPGLSSPSPSFPSHTPPPPHSLAFFNPWSLASQHYMVPSTPRSLASQHPSWSLAPQHPMVPSFPALHGP